MNGFVWALERLTTAYDCELQSFTHPRPQSCRYAVLADTVGETPATTVGQFSVQWSAEGRIHPADGIST